ncbi:MAG: hypothetical protein WBO77_01385, partial [Microgenomates group bacterium]
ALSPKCGLAGVPGSDSCCPKVNYEDKAFRVMRIIARKMPIIGGNLTDRMVDVMSSAFEYEPIHSKLEIACLSGFEKTDPKSKSCTCIPPQYTQPTPNGSVEKICSNYIPKSKELDACKACAQNGGLLTGVGCIPTDYSHFIGDFLLKFGIGLAGMIALGCIIYSAIMIQTSQGNVEKISQFQDQIKACIFGLLLIIFSIFILQLIGVNILSLPGFG